MISRTISHYKILDKIGEGVIHFLRQLGLSGNQHRPVLCAASLLALGTASCTNGQVPRSEAYQAPPVSSITVSPDGRDGGVKERFGRALDSAWKKVTPNRDYYAGARSSPDSPPPVLWSYRVSPPFPSEWPPTPAAPLYYYVYAYGIDVQVADAERLSKPWARLDIHPRSEAPAQLHVLSEGISDMGLHGVRPLTEEETEVYKLGSKVEAYLESLDGPPDEMAEEANRLRRYYCAWCYDSGIVDEIRPHHREFFEWLRCDERR